MITKLVLRNFKSIAEQTYEFNNFDLLVGRNNCGKSTILQAMAIWQFCVDEFRRAKRSGTRGIQVVLPNFSALPVPEFNLLWHEKVDRKYPLIEGKRSTKADYILIEIEITWLSSEGKSQVFGIQLRYQAPQSVHAIPKQGWSTFKTMEKEAHFPKIAYVPPFSGLEPFEEWRDDAPVRKQVGKAQPGSILRNLLYRVYTNPQGNKKEWDELKNAIQRWFSVKLLEPKYEKGVDTQILCEYKHGDKTYDIIAGGSGFHQALTLLAFLYGYKPSTILLDEPDAHMHVNLQREVLDYFKTKCEERPGVQFLVATHAEELIKGVDPGRIVSILNQKPERLTSMSGVLTAMADVSNVELSQIITSPMVLYVEGETDERILRAWAKGCSGTDVLEKVCFHHMGGGSKKQMKIDADRHYEGVKQIIPTARRLMLFDYDADDTAFHPGPNDIALSEWTRRNIENYLMVPDAWKRASRRYLNLPEDDRQVDMIADMADKVIDKFFSDENLTLPLSQSWRTVSANVFQAVDGKKLLFESPDALFMKLRTLNQKVEIIRENVAIAMKPDEIHDDVWRLFEKLKKLTASE